MHLFSHHTIIICPLQCSSPNIVRCYSLPLIKKTNYNLKLHNWFQRFGVYRRGGVSMESNCDLRVYPSIFEAPPGISLANTDSHPWPPISCSFQWLFQSPNYGKLDESQKGTKPGLILSDLSFQFRLFC